MNLYKFLSSTAIRYPQKEALVCEENTLTYSKLLERVEKLSIFLLNLKTKRGEKAGIICRNSIEYIELMFALARTGFVCVPLNFHLTSEDIYKLAEYAKLDFIFYEKCMEEKVPFKLSCIKKILNIGDKEWEKIFLTTSKTKTKESPPEAEDTACIIFTSGTTETPKAIELTHDNLIWNTINYTAAYCMSPEDKELLTTPLFHSAGFARVFTYIFNGVSVYLLQKFDPEKLLKIVEEAGITSVTQTPTMYKMMIEVGKREFFNMKSLKRVVTGASEMDRKTADAMKQMFPNASFYNLYGLTEASPGVSILMPSDFSVKPESLGKPLLMVSVSVVDDKGKFVKTGKTGEIVCAGPNIMKGYYRNPEATKKAIQMGWLRTGDMGYYDSEGFLYLAGRKKEIIVSGGVNIYPSDIEKVLLSHESVLEAAVTAISSDLWGESPAAAVVVKDRNCFSEKNMLEFCRKNMPGFKCPVKIVPVLKIPSSCSGKVVRETLRMYLQP